MNETKLKIRLYTIADFKEEEIWLREEHKNGWKLKKMVPPCFYRFEKCIPVDVIYRLDYKNNEQDENYMQMLKDYGWEYNGKCFGWLYFRKSAADVSETNDGELFSDNDSRGEMLSKIIKTRILPIAVIFFACVLPGLFNALNGSGSSISTTIWTVFWAVMFILYVFILIHCGLKLRKLKHDLE